MATNTVGMVEMVEKRYNLCVYLLIQDVVCNQNCHKDIV